MINILDDEKKMEKELKKLEGKKIDGIGARYEFIDVSVNGKEKTYKLSFRLKDIFYDRVEIIGGF